jgi:hypothetical protein
MCKIVFGRIGTWSPWWQQSRRLTCPLRNDVEPRVARWYIFTPKIPVWVNFGRSCNGRCYYILWPLDIFYGQLVNFMTIWYVHCVVLWYIYSVLVCCTKKNLAALVEQDSSTLKCRLMKIWQLWHLRSTLLVRPANSETRNVWEKRPKCSNNITQY